MAENLYPNVEDVDYYEATRYATRDQQFVSRREQALILDVLRSLPAPRKRVLDAPCGYGRFSAHLIALGLQPVNADIAWTMALRATRRVGALGGQASGIVGDLFTGLPFPRDAFDGALCVRMLHNTLASADRVAVLRSFAVVVADWLVITYYANPLLHRLQFALRKSLRPRARQTMAMVAPTQFATEAHQAGFQIERTIAVLPGLHAQTIAVLRKA